MRLFRAPRLFRWLFPERTWGFLRSENQIYLTFDDGPEPEITAWLLDLLRERNISATFFCVGSRVRQHPEILERILKEGHSVGNHTMDHERGTATKNEDYLKSVENASQFISSDLFRPPYGRMTNSQEKLLLKHGYKIIMWSWLSYDFDNEIQDDKIILESKQIRGGDILVFHDNIKTADRLKRILPKILDDLQEKGFVFKPI